MKYVNFIIVFACLVIFAGPVYVWADPIAVPVAPSFEFEPVLEGTLLTHDFIIKNQGDAPLNITDVRPPWGCDKKAFDRQIPPGGEGKITIGVKTAGYGGRELSKNILVKTDDPENKKFYLKITGTIKEIVKISPSTVNLIGAPGQTLSEVVTIEPIQMDELKILGMKLRYNKQIKAELIKPGQGEKKWQVRVSCYSDHSADIYDFITLTTDNPNKSHLRIRVYAIFEDAEPNEQPQGK